jgi:D-glycero-alpha-D-manno-heptose-7-phosphate kinase
MEVDAVGIAGGRQDHYAAAFGGALRLDFGADADGAPTRVTRLPAADATLDALVRRCVVVYTGESRISGDTITAVLDAYKAGEGRVVDALARMKAIARELADAVVAGRVDDVGALLAEHWVHQRTLHPRIPTPRIDEVVARARAAGALGAKALGASGGGCVLALAADGREDDVRAAIAPLGELVEIAVDHHGVTIGDA